MDLKQSRAKRQTKTNQSTNQIQQMGEEGGAEMVERIGAPRIGAGGGRGKPYLAAPGTPPDHRPPELPAVLGGGETTSVSDGWSAREGNPSGGVLHARMGCAVTSSGPGSGAKWKFRVSFRPGHERNSHVWPRHRPNRPTLRAQPK